MPNDPRLRTPVGEHWEWQALAACRAHALSTREPYGVRGGLSESERARILGVRSLRHPGLRSRPPAGAGRFGLGGTV